MATKVIKSLTAGNYNGTYEYNGATYKVGGSFNTDGNKVMNNISGSVKAGDAIKANFNAWKNGESFRYSFNDIQSIEELSAIASEVEAAVQAVVAELIPVNA